MSAHVVAFPGSQSGSTAKPGADDPMFDLARQIIQLTATAQPVIAASLEAAERADAEILRRLGISRDELKAGLERSRQEDQFYDRWWKTFCEVRKELSTDDVIELTHTLNGRRDEVFERMMARPIHTLSDAALLFRAAVFVGGIDYEELWGEPLRDLDWDKQVLRRLIEKLIVAGGGIPPEEVRCDGP
jgi:hypothetical protein